MGFKEPVEVPGSTRLDSTQYRGESSMLTNKTSIRAFALALIASVGILPTWSYAEPYFYVPVDNPEQTLFQSLAAPKSNGLFGGMSESVASLVKKAMDAVAVASQNNTLAGSNAVAFEPKEAIDSRYATTVRLEQTYKGLPVVGGTTSAHFDKAGGLHDISGSAVQAVFEVKPALTKKDAHRILADRYNQSVSLSSPMQLKVLKRSDGSAVLVYHALTKSSKTHLGQEVFLNAQTGRVEIEYDRAHDVGFTVYSADTDEAHEKTDGRGYPTDIDLSWYDKVKEDGEESEGIDRSGQNAYRAAQLVYKYYLDNFNRKSFDNKDTRIVSVVHMGIKMNNAFWTSEFGLMAYGDGDGEHFRDLTYGLDVTAHEMTHGVVGATCNLAYVAESGALNESFADFFGKMVDYTEGDWDIGARIMAPKWGRRALRNMKTPEEFKQPGSNDSEYRVPTDGGCTRLNDRCGVHTNSGIPNRAAALIVEAIGKEKTEQLYYNVMTSRLTATSNFSDMRRETEKACALMFGGENSSECKAVRDAFTTVKM